MIDYMAVGACIIGPALKNKLHVDLKDGQHMVFAKEDLSDLVDLCAYYLEHEDQRMKLCEQSRDFFDCYLHREQLAAYYLHCIFQKLGHSFA